MKNVPCFQPLFIRISSELLCPCLNGLEWQSARLLMRCFTQAWLRCRSWMLREIGLLGIQNALHLLHKVVSLICTLITKYHFILSNLMRHNPQLGYWWRAWSRWMIWTSYSDRGELGPLPTSPQSTCQDEELERVLESLKNEAPRTENWGPTRT